MPSNYAQLSRRVGEGVCPACHKPYNSLYAFSKQGGFPARLGRPVDGSFAKEERELRKPVEWSAKAYCSYSCASGESPAPHAQVWKLMRLVRDKHYEVSRHTTPEAAAHALLRSTALSDDQFYVEEPGSKHTPARVG